MIWKPPVETYQVAGFSTSSSKDQDGLGARRRTSTFEFGARQAKLTSLHLNRCRLRNDDGRSSGQSRKEGDSKGLHVEPWGQAM